MFNKEERIKDRIYWFTNSFLLVSPVFECIVKLMVIDYHFCGKCHQEILDQQDMNRIWILITLIYIECFWIAYLETRFLEYILLRLHFNVTIVYILYCNINLDTM